MQTPHMVQKTLETATQPQNSGAVGVITMITGASTYFELLTPIVGFFAVMVGGALSTLLIINAFTKGRDEKKLSRLKRESTHLEIEIKRETLEKLQGE